EGHASHRRRRRRLGHPGGRGADPGAGRGRPDDGGDGGGQHGARRRAGGGGRAGLTRVESSRMATAPARERILTVTELNRRIKNALEQNFPGLWVRGEITNFGKSTTGLVYFGLKDRLAQIDCVLYSKDATRLKFEPKNGLAVDAYGPVTVYEPRG